jgi:signal transduction histidine kinase
MPPIGDNLASRVASILLGSFAVTALLIMLALMRGNHSQIGPGLFKLPIPEETQAIVEALEATPRQSQPLVVRALNGGVTAVHLAPAFPPVPAGLQRAPKMERLFATYARRLGDRELRVDLKLHNALNTLAAGQEGYEPDVQLMVALKTGGVLVIEHRPPMLARVHMLQIGALFAAILLTVLAGLMLAVHQTARPVGQLAQAARRFSLDTAAPDLPTKGPREVRDLALAFNGMQGRIRELVAERTRLLAAIAHDLRTYLTRLRLRVEFMDDDDQRARAVRDIEEMSQLIADTLVFAEHTSAAATAATCNLWEEMQAVVSQRQDIGEQVSLHDGRAAQGPLAVACSPTALRRMLNNLVDNALRYGERARVSAGATQDRIELVVEDDGPGVPDAALQEVIQPFLRLEPSRARETGGAGLGLAIVKGLVESCGGRLALSNAPGGGLRAVLSFPKARP